MIWRIFFVIYALYILLMFMLGYNAMYIEFSNLQYTISLLYSVSMAFILGIFYSLGWKQALFSKKSKNIFFTIYIATILIYTIFYSVQSYFAIFSKMQHIILFAIISMICAFLLTFICINIPLIPVYFALHKYQKELNNLTQTSKPYWKLFSIYCLISLTVFLLSVFVNYSHISLYNFSDYLTILSCIFEIILVIGFSWNIKILNKLFWQIAAIPYLFHVFTMPFLISNQFNEDFHLKEIVLRNPISIICTILVYTAFIYMLYQYAYKDKIND